MNPHERLRDIEKQLKHPKIDRKQKTLLKTDKIWLEFLAGRIDEKKRIKKLEQHLNIIERRDPDLYKELTEPKNKFKEIASRYSGIKSNSSS